MDLFSGLVSRVSDNDVEFAIAVPNGRSPDAAARIAIHGSVAWDLLCPVEGVAGMLPAKQIFTSVDRKTWEVQDGRGDAKGGVVSLRDEDTARISVPSWKDRIIESGVETADLELQHDSLASEERAMKKKAQGESSSCKHIRRTVTSSNAETRQRPVVFQYIFVYCQTGL